MSGRWSRKSRWQGEDWASQSSTKTSTAEFLENWLRIRPKGASHRLAKTESSPPGTPYRGAQVRRDAIQVAADRRTPTCVGLVRFDDEMLVNAHVAGSPAPQNPVLHLRRTAEGMLFDHYLGSFDRVWDISSPLDAVALHDMLAPWAASTTSTTPTHPRPTASFRPS
jgi:hypothetical protein